eukprot:scaffold94949_cov20-Tisochrysis_lutea.AAC.1
MLDADVDGLVSFDEFLVGIHAAAAALDAVHRWVQSVGDEDSKCCTSRLKSGVHLACRGAAQQQLASWKSGL